MKKKVLLSLSTLLLLVFIAVGVNIKQDKNTLMMNLTLSNIEALATPEGGNAKDCPGGSCSYTDSWGNKCTACCPDGKDPRCTSSGCECR